MPRIRHLRWWLAGLLLVATVINYLDRQTLSVLAPLLRDLYHLSNTDYARIVFAFMLAYTFMQAGSGRIMDWLGTRRGFSLTITWWSVAAMLHAAANSALHFGLFRFLLGLGEAGNWPGGVKAVSEWFPARERAFAIGLFNSGSCLGAVIAPPLVTWIALTWGWRAAFLLTGALGFLWLVAWLILYRRPEEHPWVTPEELDHIECNKPAGEQWNRPPGLSVDKAGAQWNRPPGLSPNQPEAQWNRPPGLSADKAGALSHLRWLDLFRYRQAWGLVLARMLADPVWWFYVFWLPEYLRRERDFSLAMIGYFAWIPFLTADAGNFVGGGLSSWLIKRGWPVLRARKVVMFASASVMLVGLPAVLTSSPAWAVALISLATLAYSSWAANILTLPADLFPRGVVASVSGLSGTGAGIGGMTFTLVVGAVVDRFSYVPVFTAAALMPLVAATIILLNIRRPIDQNE